MVTEEIRRDIVDYVARHVVGPAHGENEVIEDPPHRRYLAGTLYARNASTKEVEEEEEADSAGGAGRSLTEELADDPVKLANEWLPSSLGLTLYVSGPGVVRCSVWAGAYEMFQEGRSRRWRRTPIRRRSSPEQIPMAAPGGRCRTAAVILEGKAELQAFWRPMPNGHLVTLTLVNTQLQADQFPIDTDRCLHQVGFECEVVDGEVLEYPSVEFLSDDPEDAELQLLYRHVRTFAIGHGCAAVWTTEEDVGVERVWTDLMPTYEVEPVAHGGDGSQPVLRLGRLADVATDPDGLRDELHAFVDSYREWIASVRRSATSLRRGTASPPEGF